MLAERVGVSPRTIQRDAVRGLTLTQAERYADRLGVHPWEVWPEWVELVVAEIGKECVSSSCGQVFVPKRRSQKFCSDRCREREAQIRYRATPAGRERMREQRRAFYAQCAEYQRAWRRSYYAANAEYEKARERDRYHAKKAA